MRSALQPQRSDSHRLRRRPWSPGISDGSPTKFEPFKPLKQNQKDKTPPLPPIGPRNKLLFFWQFQGRATLVRFLPTPKTRTFCTPVFCKSAPPVVLLAASVLREPSHNALGDLRSDRLCKPVYNSQESLASWAFSPKVTPHCGHTDSHCLGTDFPMFVSRVHCI